MKTDKNNMYRLIKKKHILPAILGLLLVYCLVAFLAVVISDVIVTYLCEAKMESEYKSVSYMAGIYESASDKDSIKGFLDREGRDYFIIDSDKTVLFSKGNTDTCSFTGGHVTAAGLDTFVKVYYDNSCDALKVKNEELTIQFFSLFDIIHKHNVFSKLFNTDDTVRSISIPLDFWISIDLADGSGSFVAKAAYAINEKDIAMIFVLAIALAFSALVLFIALIIRIVRKFTNQKKLLSVFFTDPVTQGHNWVWFTIKGEQLLHKKKNDKLNYAMLNISLVKYNTYCVCHSVEEGELVLQNVNKMISKSITKYDACAHHGTSSFAVLMQYSDEELLNKKVKFILRHLNGVDPTHKFAFHVGIALLPAIQYPDGKYASRKNIDIEKVYNDACAASATLDSSDDSAIAFFDNKLIEEQRWIDIVNEKQQKALDNEEFVIYYQPKYNPSTDELRGAEALIRWQSPEFGFVTPGRIIPIFEKNGFITEIDHYMITHVARDQKRWLDAGFRCVPVSVNVSRAHFIESDLAEQPEEPVTKQLAEPVYEQHEEPISEQSE